MSIEVHIRKKEQDRTLDVNAVTEKKVLSFLGGAESGASQVLRLLAGLELPDEGRILLNGEPVFDSLKGQRLWGKHRMVLLPRGYALFPELTVEENIRLVLGENEGRREKRDRKLLITTKTAQLLSEYGLDGLGGCLPGELSQPQQLMAALARTMAAEPEVIFLDHPFAGLDPYLRGELLQKLKDRLTGKEGPLLVLATADRDEAYAMGGDIAALEKGCCSGVRDRESFFREPSTVGAAVLSGCHNIAEAGRLDDWHALVPDWGAVFVFPQKKKGLPPRQEEVPNTLAEENGWEKLPEKLACIGIREEDFVRKLPEGASKKDYYRFSVFVQRIEEDLWNWNIYFCTGRAARLCRRQKSGEETSEREKGKEAKHSEIQDALNSAAFGKTAFADFTSAKYKNGEIREEPEKRSTDKPLLWRVSKREISREEIGKIRRLYVANRQIMCLTGEKPK